jgi:asparagine synthase (glutamine-hydrolysing)
MATWSGSPEPALPIFEKNMCGIAGIFRRGSVTDEDARAVSRITAAQVHRGPDDGGLYRGASAVLGHRRLSIIDLSPAGHQPMGNEDGTIQVTYNGEIYNFRELYDELAGTHRFRSRSDTEVLVHGYEQWGMAGLLARLRGMFAFAIYDSRTDALLLARDRLGIKPLYYREAPDGQSIAFASEVKALVKSGLAPSQRDGEALAGFLMLGSVPAPRTCVQGVRSIDPGHYGIATRGGFATKKYWDFPGKDAAPNVNGPDEGLPAMLADSVSRHLVSDAPVGVFLSGGVDSAGIVALASSRMNSRLKTLTVVFDEQKFSEAAEAQKIARQFGTEHQEVRVTSRSFFEEVPVILGAMDQPTNDGVNTYFVSQAAKRAGLTVVLSGLGGDEVFWGYRHYGLLARHKRLLGCLSKTPGAIRRKLVSGAAALGTLRGRENWSRLQGLAAGVDGPGVYLSMRGFFAPRQVATLLGGTVSETTRLGRGFLEPFGPEAVNGHSMASLFNRLELRRYLHDQLLRDADVFGMSQSIEVRVPFLDHPILEHCMRLSDPEKLDRSVNKPLLVHSIPGLPVETGTRAKRGFSFPMDRWMRMHAAELEDLSTANSPLETAAVRDLWTAFRKQRLHWSRAWSLVVLGATQAAAAPDPALCHAL